MKIDCYKNEYKQTNNVSLVGIIVVNCNTRAWVKLFSDCWRLNERSDCFRKSRSQHRRPDHFMAQSKFWDRPRRRSINTLAFYFALTLALCLSPGWLSQHLRVGRRAATGAENSAGRSSDRHKSAAHFLEDASGAAAHLQQGGAAAVQGGASWVRTSSRRRPEGDARVSHGTLVRRCSRRQRPVVFGLGLQLCPGIVANRFWNLQVVGQQQFRQWHHQTRGSRQKFEFNNLFDRKFLRYLKCYRKVIKVQTSYNNLSAGAFRLCLVEYYLVIVFATILFYVWIKKK